MLVLLNLQDILEKCFVVSSLIWDHEYDWITCYNKILVVRMAFEFLND
jgi:hypothetical protein